MLPTHVPALLFLPIFLGCSHFVIYQPPKPAREFIRADENSPEASVTNNEATDANDFGELW